MDIGFTSITLCVDGRRLTKEYQRVNDVESCEITG